MELRSRIERLEAAAWLKDAPLPEMIVKFIEPEQDDGGRMIPGKCTGGLRIVPGREREWLDAGLKPVVPA